MLQREPAAYFAKRLGRKWSVAVQPDLSANRGTKFRCDRSRQLTQLQASAAYRSVQMLRQGFPRSRRLNGFRATASRATASRATAFVKVAKLRIDVRGFRLGTCFNCISTMIGWKSYRAFGQIRIFSRRYEPLSSKVVNLIHSLYPACIFEGQSASTDTKCYSSTAPCVSTQ